MQKEMSSTKQCDVFDVVQAPPYQKIISSRWIFRKKPDGSYKARWVAQGYGQVPGTDYSVTYSPVCRIESIILLLIIANRNWEVSHLDVSSAFSQAPLMQGEEIYVSQAPALIEKDLSTEIPVCKLKKSFHGLKQSPRNWIIAFTDALVEYGFKSGVSDPSIYRYRNENDIVLLSLYVDDALIYGNSTSLVDQVKKYLKDKVVMKDIGRAKLILGAQVMYDDVIGKTQLSQENYDKIMLTRYGMAACNSTKTPGDNHPIDILKIVVR
ncbi:unnamed protein product [Choristocarpus tenellus]